MRHPYSLKQHEDTCYIAVLQPSEDRCEKLVDPTPSPRYA